MLKIRKDLVPLLIAVLLTAGMASAAIHDNVIKPNTEDIGTTFFDQFIIAGGPIVWFVLLPMSVIMVYLAVELCLTIRRGKLLPAGIGNKIAMAIGKFGPGRLAGQVVQNRDLLSMATIHAITQAGNDRRHSNMRNLVAESLQEQALRLLRKVEWTNIIGNVAPMVGLFGTVFGMIKAFNGIVIAGGQPQPAQLAEGISIALVTTFWGLLIAIPALTIHGVFRNRVEAIVNEAAIEAEVVLAEFRQKIPLETKQTYHEQEPAGIGS